MFQSSTTYFWASFLAIWIVAVANPVPQDLVNERNQVPDENTFLPDSGSLNFQSSLEFGIDSPSQIDPIELAEISNPTNENDYANAPTNCPKTSMLNGNDEIDPTMNVFRRKAAMCPPITQQNDQKPNYSPSVNPVRKVWNKLTDTDDIKYSCDKNSKRNKLVTCTGPEYQGEHPIGKVLNCVKGKSLIDNLQPRISQFRRQNHHIWTPL